MLKKKCSRDEILRLLDDGSVRADSCYKEIDQLREGDDAADDGWFEEVVRGQSSSRTSSRNRTARGTTPGSHDDHLAH